MIQDEISANSLFPLKEVHVSLYLNNYSEKQLKNMKVTDLVKLLEATQDGDGNAIEIPDDAEILYGFQRDEDGDVISWDEFHPLDRKGTVNLYSTYTYNSENQTSYTMQLIVGTANQLDTDNTRYIVTVYINMIEENLEYYVYGKEGDTGRQRISSKKIQSKDSSLLGEIQIPVTEVYYYPDDNSSYQAGSTCYLGIRSDLAHDEKRNINVNIYPMQNYLNYQKGKKLEGAITEQILVDESYNMYDEEKGYEADYSKPDSARPLESQNVFCIVYSDMRTGKVIAARGLIFVIPSDEPASTKGKVYAYQGGQMKEAADLTYSYGDDGRDNASWGVDQKGEVVVTYDSIQNEYRLRKGYAQDRDYYYVMDADSRINKVVRGYYDSLEEAVNEGAEDVTDQVLPKNTSAKPYGYKMQAGYFAGFTVFYKDGLVIRHTVYLYSSGQETNSDIYFYVTGAVDHENDVFRVYSDLDSYYQNGYQTLFINDTNVNLKKLIPIFYCADDVKVHAGKVQKSGDPECAKDFSKGPVQYEASIQDKGEKNYWVSFVKKVNGPKLYVNGPNKREVFLTESYNYREHDILIANVGTEELTGLKVELLDATHVKLDDYWTVGGKNNDVLGAFTTVERRASYGELFNLAKIRLMPDGEGEITGTLKISADGQKDVRIKLQGFAGNPKITTESLDEGVKYVPYSYMIATNSMYDWNEVTFSVVNGELPEGITLDKKTGELYGMPREAGELR